MPDTARGQIGGFIATVLPPNAERQTTNVNSSCASKASQDKVKTNGTLIPSTCYIFMTFSKVMKKNKKVNRILKIKPFIFLILALSFTFLVLANPLLKVTNARLKYVTNYLGLIKPRLASVTSDGAWSWFADPRAIHYQRTRNRTYVGWVDKEGNIKVASFDYKTGIVTTAIIKAKFQADDHANPAILVRPSGRIMIFWSSHAGSQMYYRISNQPESVSSWGPIRRVGVNTSGHFGYTYPNPVQLKNEGNKIYLFWRGGNSDPTFSTTVDGVNWSPARTLINFGGRPYLKVDSNETDKIHFAFTDGHPNENITSIYYFYYQAGSFYRVDGTKIGTLADLPFTPGQTNKVYDAVSGGAKAWVDDVASDNEGHPVIVYSTFPSTTDHRYRYARWTGTNWINNEITAAGRSIHPYPKEQFYSGGITLDHENPSDVYLSRQIRGIFEIEKWATPDGGISWKRTPVTSGSKVQNVRPISPRGLTSGNFNIIWMRGRYPSYQTFRTSITALRLMQRNTPPEAKYATNIKGGKTPLNVNFNGRLSRDNGGKVVRWVWNFRDGKPPNIGPTARHIFRKPGSYFPILTVTDNKGSKSQFVQEITVNP